jgi:hypothetical protein
MSKIPHRQSRLIDSGANFCARAFDQVVTDLLGDVLRMRRSLEQRGNAHAALD